MEQVKTGQLGGFIECSRGGREEEGGGGGGARGAGRGGGAGGHLLFSFHRSGVLLESSNAQTVRLGCPTSGPKPLKRESFIKHSASPTVIWDD